MRVRFGDVVVDTGSRVIVRGETRIELPPKAFQLLEALLESHPAAVAKDALYERLWPDVVVETGNLHTLIAEIRSALGDGEHRVIRTIHRFGYAFGSEVIVEEQPVAVLIIGSRVLPLHRGENVIGRDVAGSIDVSRHHARIVVSDDSISIADLESKNGTWVGGKRITTAVLTDGDEIYLGSTRAVIRRTEDAATMTAQPPVSGSRG